jgi:hypothetical protein
MVVVAQHCPRTEVRWHGLARAEWCARVRRPSMVTNLTLLEHWIARANTVSGRLTVGE